MALKVNWGDCCTCRSGVLSGLLSGVLIFWGGGRGWGGLVWCFWMGMSHGYGLCVASSMWRMLVLLAMCSDDRDALSKQ